MRLVGVRMRPAVTLAVTLALSATVAQALELAGPAQAAGNNVVMLDNFFQPQSITVTSGDTITWNNNGAVGHTATSGVRGDVDAGNIWDQGVSSGSSSPAVTFGTSGTFPYFCRIHLGMDGTVIVQAAPAPTPTRTPEPTATPSTAAPTPTASPTPRPSPTPLPELMVVPDEQITPPDLEGGVVSVVHPTSQATVDLPKSGVRLEIPSTVQAESFQVRVREIGAAGLEVGPDARALRAIEIDLFDTDGEPLQGVRFWSSGRLSIRLADSEISALGGLGAVFNDHAAGRLRIQKLSPTTMSWDDQLTSFDIGTRTFSASVLQFSTFALVWSGQLPAATATPISLTPTPVGRVFPPEPPRVGGTASRYRCSWSSRRPGRSWRSEACWRSLRGDAAEGCVGYPRSSALLSYAAASRFQHS